MSLTVRSTKHRPSRRKNSLANKPQPTTPITVTSATAVGSTLTIVFNQLVSLNGVPQYTTDVAGATPTSASMTMMNTLALNFSASIAAANALNIPYEDPAIRNASGGFVATSTFPV
jgi:hypothetical protein